MENNQENKPRLLLHSCCGPCSTTAIFTLSPLYDLTIIYYNPNIYPQEEYIKRKSEQLRLVSMLLEQGIKVNVVDADYDPGRYEQCVQGLEQEREGGARCAVCFKLRLEYVAARAKMGGYDAFATTLTVSPHKNAPLINSIGREIAQRVGVSYLPTDLKKKDGYKKSIEYSKQFGLYRQNYCGCKYSKH